MSLDIDQSYFEWLQERIGECVVIYTNAVQGKMTEDAMIDSFTGYIKHVFPSALVLRNIDIDSNRYSSYLFKNICGIVEVSVSPETIEKAKTEIAHRTGGAGS